jgi:hypothetical protein
MLKESLPHGLIGLLNGDVWIAVDMVESYFYALDSARSIQQHFSYQTTSAVVKTPLPSLTRV